VGIEYYDPEINTGWHKMKQNSDRISVLIENIYPKVDLWTWPKGIKEVSDNTGYDTALREFNEEVAANLPPSIEEPTKNPFIRKITCYGREIHEHYWTYLVDNEFELRDDVNGEVSKRKWKKLDDYPG
jgi:8-oxo-dGTP pyrophosphatase MutT (NUDIX family)